MVAEDGAFAALTDDNGMASITLPVKAGSRGPIRMTVVADGFTARDGLIEGDDRNRVLEVSLEPIRNSSNATSREYSLDVLSGEGANWGNVYQLCSDPAPEEYRVVAASFNLIAQDRQCGLYAECTESSHSNSQVCWKVRLQGHGENSSDTRRVQGKAVLRVTLDKISIPSVKIAAICHFYGEASQGSPAWNKDELCNVPNVELLDSTFHQGDFACCGGGASSRITPADIPPGLEVHVSGGYYWAVSDLRLEGNQLKIHTYCGPGAAPGPGCNVDVQVIAHYH
ncbi:MAG TPA: hypothetical protein VFA68_20030 [Terriglobales bacterium]|nr:hypothetical protein [Terriglobales bacterium]